MIRINDNMRSTDILKAALAYAEAGWRIHPLKKGSKEPLLKAWPEIATSDPKIIKKWFTKYPHSNAGGVPPINTFVLDIDGAEGKKSYLSLDLKTTTAKVISPNGSHRYLAGVISKNRIGLLKGLDLIGNDGSRYLVLPPSKVKGRSYKWDGKTAIEPIRKEHLEKIENLLVNKEKTIDFSNGVNEGARNDAIFKIACTLRRRGISDLLIDKALRSVNRAICDVPLSDKEVSIIAQSSSRYGHEYEEAFADMSKVKKENVYWFWYPYMARGCMTILEGPPGQGKSFLTMFLAALTSSGGKFPFSKEKMLPGRVLILNAEDDPASILRPRLEKCGANFQKDNIRFQRKYVPLDSKGIELLETEISAYKPDLVIIDPLLTFMIGDMHRYNEATIFMADIDQLAREYDCCIVGIRHLTKANSDDATKRGIGSVGFAARARSVIQIGKAPDNEDERAVAHAKTNLGKYGKTLIFSLKGGDRDDVPEFIWEREADYSADALNRPNDPGRPSELANIKSFLRDRLSVGPLKVSALVIMAQDAGMTCSKRTIQRALEDIAEPKGKGPLAKWVLRE